MTKTAVLAGGCFWGMQDLFRDLHPGILSTKTGYAGGSNENPTYENHPGHAEALLVEYDDAKITYRELLDFFFRIHNPTLSISRGMIVVRHIGQPFFMVVMRKKLKQRRLLIS